MIEVRKPDLADFGASFAQVSSDATRRLCEQGEAVAKSINEWNAEISNFFSHRVARNNETLGRMTKCQNVPDVFNIQAQWVHGAADDYLKEMSKLMEVNSRIMSSLLGALGKIGTQQSTETRSSVASTSMRAAE
jgi:Phasin protein